MSRYSDYPDGIEDDDILGDSCAVLDVERDDCSGSDMELQDILREIAELVGKRECVFRARFSHNQERIMKIIFLDPEKVQITTQEVLGHSVSRHFITMPLSPDNMNSNRLYDCVPEIGFARALLRSLKKNGN